MQRFRRCFLGSIVLVISGLSLAATDPLPPPSLQYIPVPNKVRDSVQRILDEMDLDRDVLIALNLTATQAHTLLGAARSWEEANRTILASLNTVIKQKQLAVRRIEEAIAVGPFDESRQQARSSARTELKSAIEAYTAALSPLEAMIRNDLSESQRITWTIIKSGWGQRMPIRMLDLSNEQRLAVSDAYHRHQRLQAAAVTEQERAMATSTWNSALETILTANQETVMQSYYANYATASEAVANAYNTVLPVQTQQAGEQ